MIELIVLCILGILWSGFATIQDLREREVANWINFSLIIFALGFRFFYSLFFGESFDFFYQGVIWLGIFFILGNVLYYSKFFAGGDAKMFIAFGSLLPFSVNFMRNVNYILIFLFIFLFIGAIWGLLHSFYYSIKNWNECKKEFKIQFKKNKKIFFFTSILGIVLSLFFLINIIFIYFGLMFFIFPYLYIYAKSIDEACMIKLIVPSKIREGDWLYNDLKIGRNIIVAKWEGLTKKEIKIIRKSKLKKVKIRTGIAFIPVFLISLIIFIYIYFSGKITLFFLF